jgi:hypothetical protein
VDDFLIVAGMVEKHFGIGSNEDGKHARWQN